MPASEVNAITNPGRALAASAMEAHGGLARWKRVRELVVRLRSGGFALSSRFQGRAFDNYEARIDVREPRLVANPFGGPGLTGVFDRGAVRLVAGAARTVIEERPQPLFGQFRRQLWWDRFDALFFGGYAIWNYFNIPFLFDAPGFELSELEPWQEQGESWRRLRAVFPDDIPTHSRVQDFYFDSELRLRRHDYTAEVFGSWAKAVHYCTDHRTFEGIVFACRRRVYPRKADNTARSFPTLVWIDVDDVAVVDD